MVIPRKAKRLKVTFLIDTSHTKKGQERIVEKSASGLWSDGEYSYFVSMLRNDNICHIKVLE